MHYCVPIDNRKNEMQQPNIPHNFCDSWKIGKSWKDTNRDNLVSFIRA